MKLKKNNKKQAARIRRATKTRCKIKLLGVLRLTVHRTSRHIYAQIIAPVTAKVLVVACSLEKNIYNNLKYTGNKESACIVGTTIAKRALQKGIKKVSFDRSGFQYHGRIQALAEAARTAGLDF